MKKNDVVTLKEAAEMLGVQAATLRSQARFGTLKTRKFGSVHAVTIDEVERYRRENLGRFAKRAEEEAK